MSDSIKHECGVAFIRLKKPLEFYQNKYGSALYGLKKLQLLMAKQLNRGQDGAGIGVIKLNPKYGYRYIARKRSISKNAVADIFNAIKLKYELLDATKTSDIEWLKDNFAYAGELLLGHLRYGTHGGNSEENIHPFLRQNNWMSRNLVLAGNYNMTNVEELFQHLIELGQHPKEISDNVTMLEKIGHFIDEENDFLFKKYHNLGLSHIEISQKIKEELDVVSILKRSFKNIDGGYNMAGMIGHGDAFIIRDPAGIRPSFYCEDDEIIVAASERPAIQTTFNIKRITIKELQPGNALIIKRNGTLSEVNIMPPIEKKSCSFERIYFSRASDADVYSERKELGRLLSSEVLEKVNYDFENTIFSYIPNSASTAFYGMMEGVNKKLNEIKLNKIIELGKNANTDDLKKIIEQNVRSENILIKDAKMRTFISQAKDREELVGEAYDVTYGLVKNGRDTIVIVDDSIVRGTTLKTSIIRIIDRLHPKHVLVVSSAPIIKYPDCYGIDMSRFNEFVAYKALISLIEKNNKKNVLKDIYNECKRQILLPNNEVRNVVKDLYNLFDDDTLTSEIKNIITPPEIEATVDVIFQKVENLHRACPNHKGDWYFTGDYPTPGGTKVALRSLIYAIEGKNDRAY
ncbi:MAG: amidophosphoribosyltransferase [Bacteroidetes bacterium]|nr:amidophosphoribosyltransferase [Bacteroidota bacterium]